MSVGAVIGHQYGGCEAAWVVEGDAAAVEGCGVEDGTFGWDMGDE